MIIQQNYFNEHEQGIWKCDWLVDYIISITSTLLQSVGKVKVIWRWMLRVVMVSDDRV